MPEPREVLLFPEMGEMSPQVGKIVVIETPVKPGDFVLVEDTILTVESDKATMDLPSPKAGRVTQVLCSIGEEVTRRMPMIEIELMNVTQQDFRSESERRHSGMTNSVFLVHGHDQALRDMTARFMEKLGLTVIILDEQVNRGDTIIEKLERHSFVQFAVVLMTGDDIGGKKGTTTDGLQGRARQNVVLELGYFMGKISRKRVCVLSKKESSCLRTTTASRLLRLTIRERGAMRWVRSSGREGWPWT